MMLLVGMPGGTIVAQKHNPAVPADVLRNIYDWMEQGATFEDVIDRLRPRTVPSGYTYSNWKSGMVDINFFLVRVLQDLRCIFNGLAGC